MFVVCVCICICCLCRDVGGMFCYFQMPGGRGQLVPVLAHMLCYGCLCVLAHVMWYVMC